MATFKNKPAPRLPAAKFVANQNKRNTKITGQPNKRVSKKRRG